MFFPTTSGRLATTRPIPWGVYPYHVRNERRCDHRRAPGHGGEDWRSGRSPGDLGRTPQATTTTPPKNQLQTNTTTPQQSGLKRNRAKAGGGQLVQVRSGGLIGPRQQPAHGTAARSDPPRASTTLHRAEEVERARAPLGAFGVGPAPRAMASAPGVGGSTSTSAAFEAFVDRPRLLVVRAQHRSSVPWSNSGRRRA